MKKPFLVAKALLSTYYASMAEYRTQLLFWILSSSLPFIMMGIWMQAASTGNFAFSSLDFARYFLATFIARNINIIWVIWEFEQDIVQGRLSPLLLQPLDPVWHYFVSHISERIVRLPFVFALVALFFALYPQAFWVTEFGDFLGFLLVTIVAFVLRFLMQYTFSLLCFWLERASSIVEFWLLPYFLLSGATAPLEVFPDAIRQIALWTPYPYFVHFPATLLLGFDTQLGKGLAIMALWIAILLPLNRWLWRQGIKHYSGMGA